MAVTSASDEIRLGRQGRLVVPAAIRQALGFKPGDRLLLRIDGEGLVLERRDVLERRLKARFAALPASTRLADELIAERRTDAHAEIER